MRPSPSDTAILKIRAKPGQAEVRRLSGSKNKSVVAKRYMTFDFTWGTMLRSPKVYQEGDGVRRASGFLHSQAQVRGRRSIAIHLSASQSRLRRLQRPAPTPGDFFYPRVNASLLRGRSGLMHGCCWLRDQSRRQLDFVTTCRYEAHAGRSAFS